MLSVTLDDLVGGCSAGEGSTPTPPRLSDPHDDLPEDCPVSTAWWASATVSREYGVGSSSGVSSPASASVGRLGEDLAVVR